MAIIHDPIVIAGGHGMPSLGSLIGSRVSSEVFDSIHGQGFTSFFGTEFDTMHQQFMTRHVLPMDQMAIDLSRTVNAVLNPDQIRMLTTIEDFRSIPPCMELAIAMYQPVRELAMEGRVDNFGFAPETLGEDFYGRLIDNFSCPDVAAAADENGCYEITARMESTDPNLSDDQLYAINETRAAIRRILETTDRDPTCVDLPRG